MKTMKKLLDKLEKIYGYRLSTNEVLDLYYQGELALSDDEEDLILSCQ